MSLPTLPTLEELLHPHTQSPERRQESQGSDELSPARLFSLSWRRPDGQIHAYVLPPELTGVSSPIVVMSGNHFPTGSHKVGPAYSCARERILDGSIRPDGSQLVFPSTGNYGIGGAWVGPRLGFKSLVVLPEEMSQERFDRIRGYGAEIIATPGCESNVKEIYDKVAELRQDPNNTILNQFADFGNYRFHRHVTGNSAVELAAELQSEGHGEGRISAFVSAMGSAGTIAAGDQIKAHFPDCRVVGVEPVQCPTLFSSGYGGHGIEGIGDKHVTWIHNVRNQDLLVCIDDQEALDFCRALNRAQSHLARATGLPTEAIESLQGVFGISGCCNVLAAIRSARHFQFGANDIVLTVATDGFDRYPSVMNREESLNGPSDGRLVERVLGHLQQSGAPWIQDGDDFHRRRWHNQKYFTWVEQQGMSVDALDALWEPGFWEAEYGKVGDLDAQTLALRESPHAP